VALLKLALERSLEEGWKEPAIRKHAFFVEWAVATEPRAALSPALISEQCCKVLEPTLGMLLIGRIVGGLDWLSPQYIGKACQDVVKIVELMTLVFCERRIRTDTLKKGAFTLDGMLRLPTSSQLVAAVVAAIWLKCRIRLTLDNNGDVCAMNIVSDIPPVEFGFNTPNEAIVAELSAYLRHGRGGHTGTYRANREVLLHAMKEKGVPADQDIYPMIKENRKVSGVDPILGFRAKDLPADSIKAIHWVARCFRLKSFEYDAPAAKDAQDAFRRLQGTLIQSIDEVLIKIHAGKAGELLSVSGKASMTARTKLFISYAHTDKRRWLGKIQKKLVVLETAGLLDVWDDTRIKPGSDWEKEIEKALKESRIALLLISDGFLASRFILDKEFSVLLERQQSEGLRLYPLMLEHCVWEENESLKRLQIKMADGFRPLEDCTRPECSKVLTEVVREIVAELKGASGGNI
jgi:hypothetical protein